MTRPFFNKQRIGHFDVFERHAEDAIQLTRQRIRDGYAVDFQVTVLLLRFLCSSLLTFCIVGYGVPIHT